MPKQKHKQLPRVARTEQQKEAQRVSAKLDAAIYACACTHCGATPQGACKRRPTTRLFPATLTTGTPHMARVHAGHAHLKANQPKEQQA